MQRRLGIDRAEAALLVQDVAIAIARLVGDGEMQHVRGQLPKSLRPLFEISSEPF